MTDTSAASAAHPPDDSRAPRFVYPLIVIVEIIVIIGLYAFGAYFS